MTITTAWTTTTKGSTAASHRPVFPLPLLGGLAWAGAACATTHAASTPTLTAVAPATRRVGALSPDERARHVLNRLAFGPRPGDEAAVRSVGVDRWIARQLEPDSIDDRDVDSVLARFPTMSLALADAARLYARPAALRAASRSDPTPPLPMSPCADRLAPTLGRLEARADSLVLTQAERAGSRLLTDLQATKLARAVVSRRQLQEVMVDFWENHFSVYSGKGPERYLLLPFDRDVIRPHALGRFRDLLGAVAHSPAMLYYLDNWQSAAEPERPTLAQRGRGARRGINENFGRELLELHTLGVDGGYTQQDVIEVARAFTGWTIEDPERVGRFVFRPELHDAGPKRILGDSLPAGRGVEDGEAVLTLLARHPATARFIATKLVRRFVSDTPPGGLVKRAARTFRDSDGDIRAVLRTIFSSREFSSRAAYRAKIKSPFELVASALRGLGAAADTTPRTVQLVAQLGEPLYGHDAPNGYPETGAPWLGSGALLSRINLGLALAAGQVPGVAVSRWLKQVGFDREPYAQQVDAIVAELLDGPVPAELRALLQRGDATTTVGLVLGSPDFQRR